MISRVLGLWGDLELSECGARKSLEGLGHHGALGDHEAIDSLQYLRPLLLERVHVLLEYPKMPPFTMF